MGRNRKHKVNCSWTSGLAYVIGVITTDGNLSPDGRHISITSKDFDFVQTVKKLCRLDNKIGKKARGGSHDKKYFVLQFGDISFYEFLLSIGLSPAKSKTLEKVYVPDKFFSDFFRGCIDGDGSIGSFTHPESRLPQIRMRLTSASPKFLFSVLKTIQDIFGINGGYIYTPKNKSVSVLTFGKIDTIKLLKLMYYSKHLPSLKRKRRIADNLMKNGQVVK